MPFQYLPTYICYNQKTPFIWIPFRIPLWIPLVDSLVDLQIDSTYLSVFRAIQLCSSMGMLETVTCYYSGNEVFWGVTNQDMSPNETCSCSRLYSNNLQDQLSKNHIHVSKVDTLPSWKLFFKIWRGFFEIKFFHILLLTSDFKCLLLKWCA